MLLSFKSRRVRAVRWAIGLLVSPLLMLLLSPVTATRAAYAAAGPRSVRDGLNRTDVSFRGGDGVILHGIVVAPSRITGRVPGIVLVGGSGPGPRQEYTQEAEAFARGGIATLVYDKRTTGYSKMHRDFSLLAADALAGVRTLRARPGVDPAKVGLWGFSEGGWVAPLAASRSSDVAFVITLGGPGRTPLRTQTWNLAVHLRHEHVSGSLLDTIMGPAAHLVDGAGLFPEAGYDPVPVLQRLRQPVLALWGEHDTQVPPRESAQIFERVLARAGNDHVTIRFVAGAGHNGHRTTDGFDNLGGPLLGGHPLGALAPGYADTMTSWIHQVAAGHPPLSSAAAPPRQALTSRAASNGAWYEANGLQWAAIAFFLLVFAGYPVTGIVRRIIGRSEAAPARRPARLLAATGLVTVAGTLLSTVAVFAAGGRLGDPVVAGRPLSWLILQLLAVIVTVATVVTATSTWRNRRTPATGGRVRVAAVVAAGAIFIPWAVYWGLLAW
ncbi:prolyl oligopeptidase family serine peptidase [Actinoallomurus purpureus]|uniref:alpha/beta hydrolase family protein n=1 Tax=Actinoallomurus purpureus TaxID=478114 RepID=UPI002092C42A|nr:acyl-CoA thioester hydrolase/BAAT C-terminal domain-containing protein [Actinoallomurus purpureus]MCO6009251.1 prolyl oligopeptidase family serine peptidase [Actinoallomurus purpureus]